ncbi:uncharacterized protein LOC113039062 [Carassius auratus]|uniref:Uncharacterized protein LOC113039062 n=1 Tax=Carassius auratus TaxID=7957 RepID=A0A6P6IYB0_CARAU|nr:uncharacterized protein LOC113039062 [Carassius auratus]
MDRHPQLSESGDDSDGSDKSIELPPVFNCAGSKPEEIIQWKLQTVDSFKRSSEELKSEYERNLPTLSGQIKKLNDIADEIESVHKKATVGSLAGSSVVVVAGAIAVLVGLALAPFTLEASLCVIVVGTVAGAAGGVTRAASITNMLKQRKLRPTVEKIISDFLEILKPMTEHLNIISNITADVQLNNEILSKLQFQTPVRGFDDVFNTAKAADVALVGKYCAEAAKEICVYEKTVRAVRDPAKAARTKRKAAAAAGKLSVLFPASIVLDLIEIFEMNQPAKERKAEEIKSQTLKFINHTRQTASQFQETLDKIKYVINTFS